MGYIIYIILCVCVPNDICGLAKQRVCDLPRLLLCSCCIVSSAEPGSPRQSSMQSQASRIKPKWSPKPALEKEQHRWPKTKGSIELKHSGRTTWDLQQTSQTSKESLCHFKYQLFGLGLLWEQHAAVIVKTNAQRREALSVCLDLKWMPALQPEGCKFFLISGCWMLQLLLKTCDHNNNRKKWNNLRKRRLENVQFVTGSLTMCFMAWNTQVRMWH